MSVKMVVLIDNDYYQSPSPLGRAVSTETNIPPPPFCRAVSANANTMGRVITIDHHYHWAEPSVPRRYKSPPPFGRAVSADANTMGRVVTINHHHHWTELSVPRPTPWAESSLLTSPQHPYPWAHPSALATAVQPAHLSEIPTISNGPIIGWPVSHGTLSTSAVHYRWTKTLKGLVMKRSLIMQLSTKQHSTR